MTHLRIIIESRDELRVIDLGDVLYLQASRNYTDFHYADGRVKSELDNLSTFEQKIAAHAEHLGLPSPFVRLGRSLLVNTDYVELVSMKLNKIAFRTNPPVFLDASRVVLQRLKAVMAGNEG